MIPSRRPCNCRTGDLFRVEREPWMRLLFPSRGLYQCAACLRLLLLLPFEVAEVREQRRQGAPASQPASVT